MDKKDWKVSVYAICKDEMKFLDKWLQNMSEADEVVVLDTGSTDGSFEFLQNDPRCTKVVQQKIVPWRFDVARNESMKLVSDDTDIYVCTDPDELFEPGWCAKLKEGWVEGADRGYYAYAWSHDSTGHPMNVFRYDKIHTKNYHWKYPVHEVLWPDNKDLGDQVGVDFGESIYLHHWQDLTKDRKNYLDILKVSVEENPDDCHVFHLYAREYILQKQPEVARRLFLKLILMQRINEAIFSEVKLDGILMLSDLARTKGEYDEALYWCNEFLKLNNTFREPYLMASDIYCICGDFKKAQTLMDLMYQRCVRHYSWVEKHANWSYADKLIMARVKLGLGQFDECLNFVNECLNYEPDSIDILKLKIACLEAMKQAELQASQNK